MNTKTSVIICAYNYARFLPRCLESILSQSRLADEIIVVDDGSTDETPAVVSRFPSVRYIRQNRAGKTEAFNRGFFASKGDLICHLDADDYWLPDKLGRVTETLSRGKAGGLTHDAFYVDGEDNYLYGSDRNVESEATPRYFSFRDVLLMCFTYRPQNTINVSFGVANTICVWREAIADSLPLPVDLGLAVDGALLLSAARQKLAYLPDKLSACRHHGNNSFISNPGSLEFQSRLFKWALSMPGAVSDKERKILKALEFEAVAFAAVQNGKEPIRGAYKAIALVSKLLQLRLAPHWKHLGLPVASLLGWKRIRRSLSRATGN